MNAIYAVNRVLNRARLLTLLSTHSSCAAEGALCKFQKTIVINDTCWHKVYDIIFILFA